MYPLRGSAVYVTPDVNPTNVIGLADVYCVNPPIVTPHTALLARPPSVNVGVKVPATADPRGSRTTRTGVLSRPTLRQRALWKPR